MTCQRYSVYALQILWLWLPAAMSAAASASPPPTCPVQPSLTSEQPVCPARAYSHSHLGPWVQGACRNATDGTEFCAFGHPRFHAGWGTSIITSAARMESLASHAVFWRPSAASSESSESSESSASSPSWIETAIPGKGIGLVAARSIRAGSVVLSRTPAVMADGKAIDHLAVPDYAALLESALSLLPTRHADTYAHLTMLSALSREVDAPAYRVFAANAFRTGVDNQGDLHSVFRDVSRINHACQPNSAYYFDPTTLALTVFAAVDIAPGEELTVSYIDPVQIREARQANIRRHWGFQCACARCADLGHMVSESDSRVLSIQALWRDLDDYATKADKTGEAELLVELLELEGLHARLHEAHYRLALEWNGVGEGVRAVQAARRCLSWGLRIRGPRQPFVRSMQELVARPEGHWSWCFRIREAVAVASSVESELK